MTGSSVVLLVTLAILAIVLYNNIEAFDTDVSYIKSSDGRTYLVLNKPDKQAAVENLSRLRIKLEKFVEHLRNKKVTCKEDTQCVQRLKERFKAVLYESKPDARYTSYTVNKGTKIYMCLRHEDKIIDENTQFFVALHELAHVMTVSLDHSPEFWRNFKILLKHAIEDGFYQYRAYHKNPVGYCGTKISDTPHKAGSR